MNDALRAVASARPADPAAVEERPPSEMTRPAAAGGGLLLAADAGVGADLLGRARAAGVLAELALHKQAETPFCIGVLGPGGVGKSAFAEQVVEAAERLAAAAEDAGLASAFARTVAVVRPDVSGREDPDALLSQAVRARLAVTHPALAADLDVAGAEPGEAARAASERLDDLRRQLEGERQALDALRGREAQLFEAAAEAPGSPLDGYGRARRSRIERALRAFGFAQGDALATYKGLVREAAEETGTAARVSLSLRALHGFKGQTRLIVWAIVLAVLGWGCAVLRDDTGWIDAIRGSGERAGPVADWLAAHLSWLGSIETVALLAAVLLLLANVLRAARFMLPLSRGVDLLLQDVEHRRRDIVGAVAHQTRRTDALARDVETASSASSDADRRATASGRIAARPEASRPAAVFDALGSAFKDARGRPDRVLVVLDGLDADPARGAALLKAARRLFGSGVVTLAIADRDRLVTGFGDADHAAAAAELARCVQVPYRLGSSEGEDAGRRAYALTLLGRGDGPAAAVEKPDARRSFLDLPWAEREAETVAALAPFAGDTPRAVKRFVNLYRVARADPRLAGAARPVFTALAIALALDAHGLPEDLAALGQASRGEPIEDAGTLRGAVTAARDASGEPVELGQAQQALEVARTYSTRA